MKKYTPLLSLFALPICAFADSEVAADTMTKDEMRASAPTIPSLPSARPEGRNGWFLFADALYWHADVGSTDWALDGSNDLTPVKRHKVHSLNFKWSWGFRAGIMANLQHDLWDSQLYYTWFHTQSKSRSPNLTPQSNIELLGSNSPMQSGKIHWTIHYSMLDWEIGKWYYVSSLCALRPHMGVKGGWINQGIRESISFPVTSAPEVTGTNKFKNHFWGVGPSFGANMVWVFGRAGAMDQHRFSLVGDVSGALMYGHFRVKHEEVAFDAGGTTLGGFALTHLNRNLVVSTARGVMGFAYDVGFNKNRNHFTFQVEYELQYWWRQNQLIGTTANFANGTRRFSDDLALQGLTIDVQFDF